MFWTVEEYRKARYEAAIQEVEQIENSSGSLEIADLKRYHLLLWIIRHWEMRH